MPKNLKNIKEEKSKHMVKKKKIKKKVKVDVMPATDVKAALQLVDYCKEHGYSPNSIHLYCDIMGCTLATHEELLLETGLKLTQISPHICRYAQSLMDDEWNTFVERLLESNENNTGILTLVDGDSRFDKWRPGHSPSPEHPKSFKGHPDSNKAILELDTFGLKVGSKKSRIAACLTDRPKTMKELMVEADVDSPFFNTLDRLVEEGLVIRSKGKRYSLARKEESTTKKKKHRDK